VLAVLVDEMRRRDEIACLPAVRAAAIGVVEVASRMMHCVFESRRYDFRDHVGVANLWGVYPHN
jgi:hypothetical protein